MSFFQKKTGNGRKKRGTVALAIFQYSKQLVAAKAYCSSRLALIDLIRYYRLYPIPNQWRVWTDFSGRELRLGESDLKSIQANIENKISIQNSKIENVCSDLFKRSSIEAVAKFSTKHFLICGVDAGGISKWIWFLCRDDRVRHFRFLKGQWENSTTMNTNLMVSETVVESLKQEKIPTQNSLKAKLNGCLPFQIKKIKVSKDRFIL